MRLDHLLSKENVYVQITGCTYSKLTSLNEMRKIFIDCRLDLHLFNLQDPIQGTEIKFINGLIAQLVRARA